VLVGLLHSSSATAQVLWLPAAVGLEIARTEGLLFGYAVAVDAGVIAVGAPDGGGDDGQRGAVHLFDAATGASLSTVTNPVVIAGDQFGFALAMGGGHLVVGAPGDDGEAEDAGAVHLVDLTTATIVRTMRKPGARGGEAFGAAVAVAPDGVIVVGAPFEDDGAGAVYRFSADPLEQPTRLTKAVPVAGDLFGIAVATIDDEVLVGAPLDDTAAADGGAVYRFGPAAIVPSTAFHEPAPQAGARLGVSVGANADGVIAGAPFRDGSSADEGAAYVFSRTTDVVTAFTPAGLGQNDRFGFAIAVAGNALAVGAPGGGAGAVHLFGPDARLDNPDASFGGTDFGFAVAVDVTVTQLVVVGAPRDSQRASDGGAAYAFYRNELLEIHCDADDDPRCDDFDPCTVESCVDRLCVHTPIADIDAVTCRFGRPLTACAGIELSSRVRKSLNRILSTAGRTSGPAARLRIVRRLRRDLSKARKLVARDRKRALLSDECASALLEEIATGFRSLPRF
jgi:hypothetical protein